VFTALFNGSIGIPMDDFYKAIWGELPRTAFDEAIRISLQLEDAPLSESLQNEETENN
jgi:hypothetical protein